VRMLPYFSPCLDTVPLPVRSQRKTPLLFGVVHPTLPLPQLVGRTAMTIVFGLSLDLKTSRATYLTGGLDGHRGGLLCAGIWLTHPLLGGGACHEAQHGAGHWTRCHRPRRPEQSRPGPGGSP